MSSIEALKQIAAGNRPAVCAFPKLLPPLTPPWLKSYYEPCSHELINLIPKGARSILCIATGTGATECELARLGFDVTAIPLDSVICASAESGGVKMVYCELMQASEKLKDQRFDCVLIRNLLYLHEDPTVLIARCSSLLVKAGCLIISEPNFGNIQTRAGRLLRKKNYRGLGCFSKSRVTLVTEGQLRRWLKAAGLVLNRLIRSAEQAVSPREKVLRLLPLRFSATVITILAQRRN
jgi:2-polyprenyl-3-methyl-5-hydroxy-6-metoxy-1,4-benzoquinol methylase